MTLLVVERAKLVHTPAELARLHPGADVSAPEGSVGIPDLFTSPVAADGPSPVGRRSDAGVVAGPACISQRAPHRPAGGSPGARRRPSVPRGRGRTGSSSPVPAIGVLTVERTSDAVVESVEILAESDDPLSSADLAGLAGALHAARARTALVGHGVGYTGLTRPARFTGSTVPAVALFGPEALAATGAAPAARLASESGGDARPLGAAPAQSLAVQYAQEEIPGRQHSLEAYASLVGALALVPPADRLAGPTAG
ncbi:hypothetical protein ASF21_10160 [Arthrobacter sp. Leaf234]|uniref:DUF6177 family protein n=1 Tax=Arthrobacter sp. Leaf234 TaxID=1736303 RepID=UPI0006F255A4|nr:DUF6177 family protein [Arthrobacter sp. Leaf234]KQO01906.1 hypothetical protein ASF21_10160 [Arthrobacter sp. Leaf234]